MSPAILYAAMHGTRLFHDAIQAWGAHAQKSGWGSPAKGPEAGVGGHMQRHEEATGAPTDGVVYIHIYYIYIYIYICLDVSLYIYIHICIYIKCAWLCCLKVGKLWIAIGITTRSNRCRARLHVFLVKTSKCALLMQEHIYVCWVVLSK